jgi:thiamine-monophosphate kinase
MALFGSSRDVGTFKGIARELLENVISQQVGYYKYMLEDKSVGLTPLAQLGEFGLIDRLTRNFNPSATGLKVGPGDDCAVWEKNEKEFYLASTDVLAEGIHFDLSYCPLKHLGYKAIAVNISDICAMNGQAWGILVSIGFSNRFSVEALDELYAGIHAASS